VNTLKLILIFLGLVATPGLTPAQQNDPSNKPSVIVENKGKPPKESNSRTIEGTVKDAVDNPAADAIVQLKDTKTSQVVNFTTKGDGKFVFRDLYLDVNYELLAKRGDITTPMKKVSIYDTRKNVIVNFQLTPPPKPQ
jgi:hypothetical protein